MNITVNIVDGDYSDIKLFSNILDDYGVSANLIKEDVDNQSLGIEELAAFAIVMPIVNQSIANLMPVLVAYIEALRPSGTKKTLELINGEKKVIITDEKGELLNAEEIDELIKRTGIFLD